MPMSPKGMLMMATELLRRDAHPSEQDIRRAISGNLCRCTGYASIIRAVHRAAGDPVAAPIW